MTARHHLGLQEAKRRIAAAHAANAVSLDLRGLNLTALPESVLALSHLEELDISLNRLTVLPEPLHRLTQLQELVASFNALSTLPPALCRLARLRILDVSANELSALPGDLGRLSALVRLDVSRNRLTALSDSLGQLTRLRELNAEANDLQRLPAGLRDLAALSRLFLQGNPGLGLPPEVLGPGCDDVRRHGAIPMSPQAVLALYFATGDSKALNEAKMILVGRGGAGKTSIVRRLSQQGFSTSESATRGVSITAVPITRGAADVRLNVWDFGGQEIMHATHMFFLTRRSLYLLVINAREGAQDSNIDYWLRLIESFGANSPVIVAINKIKGCYFSLNRRGLSEKFPSIRYFVETDCAENLGIEELRQRLEDEVDKLAHVRDLIPSSWLSVKNALPALKENFITYERYRALCDREGVTDTLQQETLLSLLHDLGTIVSFREDPRLRDVHILDPHWVTNGIYTIVTAEPLLIRGTGELRLDDLAYLLDAHTYPRDKHRFLLDLMERFELCYEFYDKPGAFLVPEFLSKEQPDVSWLDTRKALRFEYHYNVLPEALLPRFIVRARALNENLPRWRSGVVLELGRSRALIRADIQAQRVSIAVTGPPEANRELLSLIRFDFDAIHASIARLRATEVIPVPEHPGMTFTYEELRIFKQANQASYKKVSEGELVRVNVRALLDKVEAQRTLRVPKEYNGIQVALSYAHIDKRLRDRLEVHLKVLQKNGVVETWHDNKITPGRVWAQEIDAAFRSAELFLMLVSPDFMASSYCIEVELHVALDRQRKGLARVIPVILRPCDWQDSPLRELQALPAEGKAITLWRNRDEAWVSVVDGIRKAVEEIRVGRRMNDRSRSSAST